VLHDLVVIGVGDDLAAHQRQLQRREAVALHEQAGADEGKEDHQAAQAEDDQRGEYGDR
jgi:hypothetical protein